MNKQLRALSFSASDIGYCLVCGGLDGNCTCITSAGSVLRLYKESGFYDLRRVDGIEFRRDGPVCSSRYLYCKFCSSVLRVDLCSRFERCECGSILKHDFVPSEIGEPDFSIFEGLSDLPRRALRKPKL